MLVSLYDAPKEGLLYCHVTAQDVNQNFNSDLFVIFKFICKIEPL